MLGMQGVCGGNTGGVLGLCCGNAVLGLYWGGGGMGGDLGYWVCCGNTGVGGLVTGLCMWEYCGFVLLEYSGALLGCVCGNTVGLCCGNTVGVYRGGDGVGGGYVGILWVCVVGIQWRFTGMRMWEYCGFVLWEYCGGLLGCICGNTVGVYWGGNAVGVY